MTQLYVRVCLHGAVADQRLCSVGDEVWLGSAPDALVSFPGPSIQVRRFGRRLQVRGRWLDPGRPMRLKRGDLEVYLEAVERRRSMRDVSLPMPDLRVLVASAAVMLLGAWWEAVGTFIERHPEAMAVLSGRQDAGIVHHAAPPDAPQHLRARVHEAESHQGEEPEAATEPEPSLSPTSYPVGFITEAPRP